MLLHRENIMKVDIFFRELKHEKIIQRPAFEFESLISEVGGFLGLLLGASVLTVCEVIDFISVSVARKFKMTQKIEPVD